MFFFRQPSLFLIYLTCDKDYCARKQKLNWIFTDFGMLCCVGQSVKEVSRKVCV